MTSLEDLERRLRLIADEFQSKMSDPNVMGNDPQVCREAADLCAKLRTLEPVAWRTFDGEGGYDLRNYEDNENYRDKWERNNPKYKRWVEPLYNLEGIL